MAYITLRTSGDHLISSCIFPAGKYVLTEKSLAFNPNGPNLLLLTIPSHSIQSLELLQQEHCICVIPILIDYL
jgi:hypothetical protein